MWTIPTRLICIVGPQGKSTTHVRRPGGTAVKAPRRPALLALPCKTPSCFLSWRTIQVQNHVVAAPLGHIAANGTHDSIEICKHGGKCRSLCRIQFQFQVCRDRSRASLPRSSAPIICLSNLTSPTLTPVTPTSTSIGSISPDCSAAPPSTSAATRTPLARPGSTSSNTMPGGAWFLRCWNRCGGAASQEL